MKIILYSTLIIIFCSIGSIAEIKDPTIKSHLAAIDTTSNDTTKLEHLIHLSWDYRNYSIDSAFHYSDSSIKFAKKIGHKKLLAKAFDIRSILYQIENKLDSAEIAQNRSLSIRQLINDKRGLRSSYEEMGNIKRELGNYDRALENYIKALEMVDSIDFNEDEIRDIENFEVKELDEILEIMSAPVEDESKYNIPTRDYKHPLIANLKRLIGETYMLKNDFKNAQKFLNEALVINYKLLDADQMTLNELSLGRLYLQQNMTDSVKSRMSYCIPIAKSVSNYKNLSEAYFLLSDAEYLENKYKKALVYLDSATVFHRKYNSTPLEKFQIQKLKIFTDSLADNYNPDLSNSIYELTKELHRKIDKNPIAENRLNFLNILKNYYHLIDEKDSVIKYQNEYYTLKDSLIGLKTQERLIELLELYNAKEKEKTIISQKEQILTYENLLLILGILIITIILISLYLIYSERKTKNLNKEIIRLNKELRESTKNKEKLFSFIAHDLRGPLQTARSVVNIITGNSVNDERKKHYLNELNELLVNTEFFTDNLLQWHRTKSGNIKAEIKEVGIDEIIENAVSLFKTKTEEKDLNIEYKNAGMQIESDPVLLQAIVNNLLQNAVKYSGSGNTIKIDTIKENNSWKLTISNPAGKDNAEEPGYGIGLTIVENFSDLLGIEYKTQKKDGRNISTLSD